MENKIPKAFFWRRMQSIMGIWLTLFLIGHLLTNSQAALLLGGDGHGFIHSVNSIHELPYLPVIEILILAVPILIHTIWGIYYIRTAKFDSFKTDGSTPSLPEYPRNQAYTWQRITAWLLVIGIAAHVIHMRFIEYPASVQQGDEKLYMVKVSTDGGLYTLSERLGVTLLNKQQVKQQREDVGPKAPPIRKQKFRSFLGSFKNMFASEKEPVSVKEAATLLQAQKLQQQRDWVETLEKHPLNKDEVIAVTHNFGTAELLMVRDTFKSPLMMGLYTLFVLTACFHGFNGLWTFLITWGVTITERSQKIMLNISTALMVLVSLLGLSAIWLTYWVNLYT